MQEQQITIKGLQVNYKKFGNGEKTMLILHGWPSKSDRWQTVAELLEQKDVTIIVPDLPGFGGSQEPPIAWSIDTYVEWLHEFVDQIPALKDSFYLAGHSFGGALAAKFTIKYNQRVEKLFLISAACVRQRTTAKNNTRRIAKVVKLFSFIPYYDLFRRGVYKYILRRSDYVYVSGIMKETYLKVISDDLSQKLGFINPPTVIIWGDKDVSTPLSDAEFIHQKISHSKLLVIPGADHALQIKVPEALAAHIIENI